MNDETGMNLMCVIVHVMVHSIVRHIVHLLLYIKWSLSHYLSGGVREYCYLSGLVGAYSSGVLVASGW